MERSSWIALRILGCAHTNPIFVIVGGRPIRASRKSAEWCLRRWISAGRRRRGASGRREREAARRAYEHARRDTGRSWRSAKWSRGFRSTSRRHGLSSVHDESTSVLTRGIRLKS